MIIHECLFLWILIINNKLLLVCEDVDVISACNTFLKLNV